MVLPAAAAPAKARGRCVSLLVLCCRRTELAQVVAPTRSGQGQWAGAEAVGPAAGAHRPIAVAAAHPHILLGSLFKVGFCLVPGFCSSITSDVGKRDTS